MTIAQHVVRVRDLVDIEIYLFVLMVSNIKLVTLKLPLKCPGYSLESAHLILVREGYHPIDSKFIIMNGRAGNSSRRHFHKK